MRIAFEDGYLYVHCKNDNTGKNESKVLLGTYADYIDCEVNVEKQHLMIHVNGTEKFNKKIAYWEWSNYFKAGAYPQAHFGTVTVKFASLAVEHY
jgi:hypothetical protein